MNTEESNQISMTLPDKVDRNHIVSYAVNDDKTVTGQYQESDYDENTQTTDLIGSPVDLAFTADEQKSISDANDAAELIKKAAVDAAVVDVLNARNTVASATVNTVPATAVVTVPAPSTTDSGSSTSNQSSDTTDTGDAGSTSNPNQAGDPPAGES